MYWFRWYMPTSLKETHFISFQEYHKMHCIEHLCTYMYTPRQYTILFLIILPIDISPPMLQHLVIIYITFPFHCSPILRIYSSYNNLWYGIILGYNTIIHCPVLNSFFHIFELMSIDFVGWCIRSCLAWGFPHQVSIHRGIIPQGFLPQVSYLC